MSIFKDNLLKLKELVENNLPQILNIAGLTALDEYVLGGPSDEDLLSMGFYLGPGDQDPEQIRFKPVIQLQLKGVKYSDSVEYFDKVHDYLNSIDEVKIGMTAKERFNYTEFPPDETGTTIYTFYPEYLKQLDDCYE